MTKVYRAYRDSSDTLIDGAVISTMACDGTNRRVSKAVDDSGDWDHIYNFYYDGQSMIETRNGDGYVIKQHVWGTQYVDELTRDSRHRRKTSASAGCRVG